MPAASYSSSTIRHSAVVGGDDTVFTADTWTICTIKVPSAAAGATYVYTDTSSKNEAYKPESGDQMSMLLAPGTTLKIATDAAAAVEFSVTQTQLPIEELVHAAVVIKFILAVYTKEVLGWDVPDTETAPPFYPSSERTTRGPGRVYIDPRLKMKQGSR